MDNNFNMTFEESQDYIAKRGFDIPWNDCDVFVDEREINRTVGNVLKWADKTMIEKTISWFYKNGHKEKYWDKDGCLLITVIMDDYRQAMEE